jgi:hypothetical protein
MFMNSCIFKRMDRMRLAKFSAALLAAALWFFPTESKADFVLSFGEFGGPSFTLTQASGSGTVTSTSSGVSFSDLSSSAGVIHAVGTTTDGYSFDFTATSNRTSPGSTALVSLDGSLTGAGGKVFSYSVAEGTTAGAPGFTFPGTGSSTVGVTANLQSGSTFHANEAMTGTITNQTTPSTGTVSAVATGPNQTSSQNITFTPRGNSFSLQETGTIFQTSAGKTAFTSSVVVSLPEPNGVLIGMLCLPCMGAVVFFARRRSFGMGPVAA